MKKTMILIIIFIIILITYFFIFNKKDGHIPTIRIMVGDVLTHSPLYVMNELHLIEKYASNAKIDFRISSSGGNTANEAFIAEQLDISVLDISNFTTGLDKGIPYKIASPLAYTRYGLQTNNPNIKTLKDIGPNDKIAVSSLTGTPTTLLRIACEKEFGDADALKENIITMDAYAAELALINKSSGISLHMISLSCILRENQTGCPTILDDIDILSEKCANVFTVATIDFVENYPDLYDAYLSALEEAITLINNKDEEALEIISKYINISKEELIEHIDSGNLHFSTSEYNFLPITDFLYRTEGISTKIESLQEFSFPNVTATK